VPALGPWAVQLARVRERAAAIATAPAIDEACRRMSGLVEACAACHRDAGVQAELRPPLAAPPDLPTVAARMARHRWATDRIREGMIGDADDAWRAGFEVLAAAPMSWPQPSAEQAGLARRLQRVAGQALHAGRSGRAERARLYGETLIVCAACHARPAR
jgi:cytochrome c